MTKCTLKFAEEEMAFEYLFQIRKLRKCCRRSTDIIASLKQLILVAISYHGRKETTGNRGRSVRVLVLSVILIP